MASSQDPEEQYVAAREALTANLRLQKRLKEALQSIERGIGDNADMQAKVLLSAKRDHRQGWYTGMLSLDFPKVGKVRPKAVGPSRFWIAASTVPEPNSDTLGLLEAYKYLPHTFTVKRWQAEEDAGLQKAVLYHLQEQRHEKVMTAAIEDGSLFSEQDLEEQIQQIGDMTLDAPGAEEEVLAFEVGHHWELIATQLASGRTAAECMSRWRNHLRPSLKRNLEWSDSETAKLDAAVQRHECSDWEKIAEDLGTGRSPVACLAKFQQQQQQQNIAKPWSKEEVQALQQSFARHSGKGSFWKAIAADLPGRTAEQVMHYWRNHMQASKRKGRWSLDEDDALLAAVKVFGKKWSRVAEAVPSRTQVQCRERYVNILDPNLKRGAWTKKEDEIIAKGLEECRNPDGSVRWADIAARLPGRTDDAVSNHVIFLRNTSVMKRKREASHQEKKGDSHDCQRPSSEKNKAPGPTAQIAGADECEDSRECTPAATAHEDAEEELQPINSTRSNHGHGHSSPAADVPEGQRVRDMIERFKRACAESTADDEPSNSLVEY